MNVCVCVCVCVCMSLCCTAEIDTTLQINCNKYKIKQSTPRPLSLAYHYPNSYPRQDFLRTFSAKWLWPPHTPLPKQTRAFDLLPVPQTEQSPSLGLQRHLCTTPQDVWFLRNTPASWPSATHQPLCILALSWQGVHFPTPPVILLILSLLGCSLSTQLWILGVLLAGVVRALLAFYYV